MCHLILSIQFTTIHITCVMIKMLMEDTKFIKRTLIFGSYYRCLPVKWDSNQDTIVLKRSKQQNAVLLSLLIHGLALISRIFATFKHSSSLLQRAQAAIAMVTYLISFLIRLDLPIDPVTVHLVNYMIRQPADKFGKYA